MALKFSEAVRNARLNAIETTIGTAPVMKIRSGAPPANVAAADTGTVLATITLASDWASAAAAGAKALAATASDASADATETAGHFRLYASDGTTAHLQGTITAAGGGGDMIASSLAITATDTVTLSTLTLTDGNA